MTVPRRPRTVIGPRFAAACQLQFPFFNEIFIIALRAALRSG